VTHEELIQEARKHTTDIPRLSGQSWATPEALPKTTVADAVVVSFKGDQPDRQIFVVLERDSGKFVASGLRFRKNSGGNSPA
jgi:hypothetical protein